MKQTSINTAVLAALILFLAACSNELPDSNRTPEKQPGEAGPLITVTATQDGRPQTRLGYDDPNDPTSPISVTWAAEDQFFVGKDWSAFTDNEAGFISAATAYFSPFALEGEGGSKSAEFTGNLPTDVQNGATLYGIYGDGKRITLDKEEKGALFFDYTNQVQSANGDKAHLSGVDFMVATTKHETGKQQPIFAFKHIGAMIKFTLTLPTEGMTVKKLELTTTDGSTPFCSSARWNKGALAFSTSKTASASTTLLLGEDQTGITLTDTKILTAYMMVAPTTLTSDKKLLLKATDASDVVYAATLTGATIEQGNYYTVQAEPVQLFNEMKFDIKVEAGSLDFRIPFPTSGNTPDGIDITVNWGDGNMTTVSGGTALTSADGFKHPYGAADTYTITITSSQIDATKLQIPLFKFNENSDAKKLISMNTPMLNIETYYLSSCFAGCTNLTSLSSGLFDKNTKADDFSFCFDGCTSLKELPQGLFDKNIKATDFSDCFADCSSLTSLPQGLFDKNANVEDFSYCFDGCASLKELPQGLFDNNKLVEDFSYCFRNCDGLTEPPSGLFVNNEKVKNFASCFALCSKLASLPDKLFDKNTNVENFNSCFSSCTSLASLPQGLFEKNINATDFSRCFYYCEKLVLNETIFSAATPDARKTRFSGKTMKFSSCFGSTGSKLTNDQQLKSEAPRLWEYEQVTATWTTTDCYTDCKASNLEDVPDTSKWGTPAPAPDKGISLGDRENATW